MRASPLIWPSVLAIALTMFLHAAGAPILPNAAKAKCGVADLKDGATLDPAATETKGASVKYIKSIAVAGENKKLACAQACCDEADCDLAIYELIQEPINSHSTSGGYRPNNCFLLSCQPFNACVFKNTSDMNALAIVTRTAIKSDEVSSKSESELSTQQSTNGDSAHSISIRSVDNSSESASTTDSSTLTTADTTSTTVSQSNDFASTDATTTAMTTMSTMTSSSTEAATSTTTNSNIASTEADTTTTTTVSTISSTEATATSTISTTQSSLGSSSTAESTTSTTKITDVTTTTNSPIVSSTSSAPIIATESSTTTTSLNKSASSTESSHPEAYETSMFSTSTDDAITTKSNQQQSASNSSAPADKQTSSATPASRPNDARLAEDESAGPVSFMPGGRTVGGLAAALVFGCAFTLVVAALSCRVLCEAWSRRHYSKVRYLDNGGNSSGF